MNMCFAYNLQTNFTKDKRIFTVKPEIASIEFKYSKSNEILHIRIKRYIGVACKYY